MDERKVQSVVNWPRLLTVKELQRILALLIFIEDSFAITSQLQHLDVYVQEGSTASCVDTDSHICLPRAEKGFTFAPILHHLDPRTRVHCGGGCIQHRYWCSSLSMPR